MPVWTCTCVSSVLIVSHPLKNSQGGRHFHGLPQSTQTHFLQTRLQPSPGMSSGYKLFSVINCLLLLAVLCPAVQARRGGGFGRGGGRGGGWGGSSSGRAGWGAGGGHYRGQPAHGAHPSHPSHGSHPSHHGASAGHSTGKVVGAAAAGALGGMMVGHGLSSLTRPGYGYGHGYGGYGGYGYGHGYGHGHGHGHGVHHGTGEHNETDVDYYTDAASNGLVCSSLTIFGLVTSLFLGHFLS